jgi:hypothetical protein
MEFSSSLEDSLDSVSIFESPVSLMQPVSLAKSLEAFYLCLSIDVSASFSSVSNQRYTDILAAGEEVYYNYKTVFVYRPKFRRINTPFIPSIFRERKPNSLWEEMKRNAVFCLTRFVSMMQCFRFLTWREWIILLLLHFVHEFVWFFFRSTQFLHRQRDINKTSWSRRSRFLMMNSRLSRVTLTIVLPEGNSV